MRKFIALLGLAALLIPAFALAGEPENAQAGSHAAAFAQTHQKMMALHVQARAQILAALTPAHRAAFANLVGQLAISSNPDPDAAVRRIDAMLSPAEAQAIVRIHDAVRAQAHAMMTAMESTMPRDPKDGPGEKPDAREKPGAMERPGANEKPEAGEKPEAAEKPDAGRILLMMAMPIPWHEMGKHHMM